MIPQDFRFVSASDMGKALEVMENYRERAAIIAGGTDLIVDMRAGKIRPEVVLDLGQIQELKHLTRKGGFVRIGSMVTIQEVADFRWEGPENLLREAAQKLGTMQVRNRATVGGNLARGSPASDMAVPLLCFDAEVVLVSKWAGKRTLPLSEFFGGTRSTGIFPGEILTEVRFGPVLRNARWSYKRLGRREGPAISVVTIGGLISTRQGECNHARIALGAVAPVPFRATRAETVLLEKGISSVMVEDCALACADQSSPITDIRACASYRREMTIRLARTLLTDLLRPTAPALA